ncbi:unnamed protein product [Trichobilharzia regenti]|nr:unnamed protein product [Trichobilharzia regenti]
MDNSTTNHYCGLMQQLIAKSRSAVRDLDPSNDLTFLRIRSVRHEIMVAPGINLCCSLTSMLFIIIILFVIYY